MIQVIHANLQTYIIVGLAACKFCLAKIFLYVYSKKIKCVQNLFFLLCTLVKSEKVRDINITWFNYKNIEKQHADFDFHSCMPNYLRFKKIPWFSLAGRLSCFKLFIVSQPYHVWYEVCMSDCFWFWNLWSIFFFWHCL